ncbi:PREDICTED: uncharacterized protein C1orf112 homolog isoform X4 [Dipodomys ordii]|uniref:Uncharacterized protein C1orf112 homolog isoform X4 n=1 Tax=Dipodomys ordii TaxID=10020 RepID=A0A1S3F5K6_DIPOR|nr:PREDICTED: uncharacterized protein C1orf112 homolog isoform X4 [Dipodomys ordii]
MLFVSSLTVFYSMYQHSESWTEHIQILKVIIEMFLPHMNHLTLEQAFFSQVLPKTVKLFDDMIYELTSQAGGLSSQNLEIQTTLRNILQTMVQVLEVLTGCVQHVCTTQESVVLEKIHSLPSSVLHVIRSTFVHCKNSESVYSGRLHLVSDLLQALFKEAYSLQKQLMELLDAVFLDPSVDSNDDILDMVIVIHSLLDICSVISSMDQAFHANTWKFIIKQTLKHQSLVKNQLKHKDIISSLCEDILFSFHSCLQLAEQMTQSESQDNADYRLFQKTLKLCRFFANSLLHYTKEFHPFLSDSCSILHRLYLQIYSKLPPSLYAARISKAQQEEVACAFLVTLDPLVSQLLPLQSFMQAVLDSKLDLPCELQFPQCLLLVVVMDKLPSQPEHVQTLWCTENQVSEGAARISLFRAIFYSFEQCSGELSLPVHLQGVESKGRAEAASTLYQHVCVHLCTFITSFHPSLFAELDTVLLNAVLGVNMITSLLAMDVWCFVARCSDAFLVHCRYGTAELCAHHVTLVAHLIKSSPGECQQLAHLSILLKRLFFLMAPPHQVVSLQTSLLKLEPADHVRFAVLDFVSSLGKLFIPQVIQDKILPNLSCIFALLLADRNWLLEQHTLEAFTQFAEGTHHEEIVPQCVSSEEIKNKVVTFLEKSGCVDEDEAAKVERVKQEKAVFWVPFAEVTEAAMKRSSLQPSAKRARHDLPLEEEYRSALQAATRALDATESLIQKTPAPAWLLMEMETLQQRIERLKRQIL